MNLMTKSLHHDLIFFVTTSIFGNKNNVSLKTTGHASWDLSRNEVNTPSGELGNIGNIMISAPADLCLLCTSYCYFLDSHETPDRQ